MTDVAFPLPCDYEDTDVSDVSEPDVMDDDWDSGAYEGYDYYEDDADWDDGQTSESLNLVPMRTPTPTPMDEDVPTSRRGHDYEGERDELYRDRLLSEGHVVCLERGGDWSLVMASNVEVL